MRRSVPSAEIKFFAVALMAEAQGFADGADRRLAGIGSKHNFDFRRTDHEADTGRLRGNYDAA